MGYRGRRTARYLREGKVPRRHPAHDGHPPSGRRARTDERRCAPHESPAGRRWCSEPGCRVAPGGHRVVLQHVSFQAPRPDLAGTTTAAAGRLRGLPRWLLAQCPGSLGEVQVPQPDSHSRRSGRPGLPAREVPGQVSEPQPAPWYPTATGVDHTWSDSAHRETTECSSAPCGLGRPRRHGTEDCGSSAQQA